MSKPKVIICPTCSSNMKTEILLDDSRQGYPIDYCTGCAGIWLDGGELQKIIEAGKRIPLKILNMSSYKENSERTPEGNRICPRCGSGLSLQKMNGITIDVCQDCKGILFDQSELYDLLFINKPASSEGSVDFSEVVNFLTDSFKTKYYQA